MLAVLWKDFEQEPLHKGFLKALASMSKIPLHLSSGTNHSDYCLRYAAEINGDYDNFMSNPLSFMVN